MPQKVSTGQLTITDLMDGLNARLSNEAHLLPATSDGQVISYAGCETSMSVFQGNQDDTTNWEFSAISSVGTTGGFVPFKRASTATYIDGNGAVQTAAVDVLRFQGGVPLVEGAGTNLIRQSESLVTTPWANSWGTTATVVDAGSGFSVGKTFLVTATSAGGGVRQVLSGLVSGVRHVWSFFISSSSTTVRLLTENGTATYGQGISCTFNPLTGVFAEVPATYSAAAVTASGGWLVFITFPPAAGALGVNLEIKAPISGSSFVVGRLQFEPGTTPTSYMPTTTVAVTRAADIYRPSTYAVTGMTIDSGVVDITASKQGFAGITSRFSVSKVREGMGGIAAILSNESHTFPANSAGSVSSYVGSGTEIRVYEGATQLAYDGVGTANGTWKVTAVGTNITVGTLTDSGAHLTVGNHLGVAQGTDVSSVTYTVVGKTSAGIVFTLTKVQSFTKSKAGTVGVDGAPGPAVMMVSDRPATFTSTDTVLDTGQANIVLTANTQGLTSPTFAWTFSGMQTNPTASTTASQTITAAQFGTSKSAIVIVTVNGSIVDKMTIVRLERSTAEAGATVGANETNLTVGLGANLLINSDLSINSSFWALGWNQSGVQDISTSRNLAGADWQAIGTNNFGVTRSGTPTGVWDTYNTGQVPVRPGQRYEVSGYMASHRCNFDIGMLFYNASNTLLLEVHGATQTPINGGKDLANWTKVFAFATAPVGARYVQLICRSIATGETNPYTWVTQPFLGIAGAAQTTPSPWSASNYSERITAINASTWIADAAIGTVQIGDAAITRAKVGTAAIGSAQIGDAEVNTLKIQGNAVTVPVSASSSGSDVSVSIDCGSTPLTVCVMATTSGWIQPPNGTVVNYLVAQLLMDGVVQANTKFASGTYLYNYVRGYGNGTINKTIHGLTGVHTFRIHISQAYNAQSWGGGESGIVVLGVKR